MSGFAQAQHYYFFCINTTESFDANWVVDQIDPILSKMKPNDRFTVFYTTGTDMSNVILDPLIISDYKFWRENKGKLKQFEAEKIQCNANENMGYIMDAFEKVCYPDRDGLNSGFTIEVYWFGDDAHYSDFGESLVLNAYVACAGSTTWDRLVLRNNCAAPLKTNSVPKLLNSKLFQTNNIYIQ